VKRFRPQVRFFKIANPARVRLIKKLHPSPLGGAPVHAGRGMPTPKTVEPLLAAGRETSGNRQSDRKSNVHEPAFAVHFFNR